MNIKRYVTTSDLTDPTRTAGECKRLRAMARGVAEHMNMDHLICGAEEDTMIEAGDVRDYIDVHVAHQGCDPEFNDQVLEASFLLDFMLGENEAGAELSIHVLP